MQVKFEILHISLERPSRIISRLHVSFQDERAGNFSAITNPVSSSTQFMLMRVVNFTIGISAGY